jgi:hypothetical protein
MNCQECKNQIEDGSDLSRAANDHLQACQGCQNFHIEHRQLSQMMTSLPQVKAPKDFEFGVKAKLAESKSDKTLSPVWQALRYILPLSVAGLIFAFAAFNSNLFNSREPSSPIVKSEETIEKKNQNSTNSFEQKEKSGDELVAIAADAKVNEDSTNSDGQIPDKKTEQTETDIASSKTETRLKPESNKDQVLSIDIKREKELPKSKDSASTSSDIINPRGSNVDDKINNLRVNKNSKLFTASDILSPLGISTINEDGKLRVTSLRDNSLGKNSGVKVGDVIIAIDGQVLSSNPIKTGIVEGNILRVRRNGQEIVIAIRNR